MPRLLSLSLVRTLARAVATGSVAGLTSGIAMAHWQPELGALLSAEHGATRVAFLIVCMQVGIVVALAIAMLPDPEE